jgi:predicted O-linked N-acetylglucosamine transferase (SPINDLY family)
MPDDKVAQMIRDDRIDILVDLTMHMAGGRPLVFARKPAPIQVAWLGYPGTTGLPTIDYRLTDPHLDPPGQNDAVYTEKTVRLADTFWCYYPYSGAQLPGDAPAEFLGYVTFGCLNNLGKVNEQVLRLWARVLRRVENSHLLMLSAEGNHRQAILDIFQSEGVDPQRVEMMPRCPRPDYLQAHYQIDIGLDTFPYNGHTTSLDAMWMGVPIVTLRGPTVVGRAGVSQLTNLKLTDLIAQTPDEFVEIAARLADDLPRVVELHRTLRDRMAASPLTDASRFARNVESAFRQMWKTWCGQK